MSRKNSKLLFVRYISEHKQKVILKFMIALKWIIT